MLRRPVLSGVRINIMSTGRATRKSSRLSGKDTEAGNNAVTSNSQHQNKANGTNGSKTSANVPSKRKSTTESMLTPATPSPKKQKKALVTPSPKKTIALDSGESTKQPLEDRPAQPFMTNAPLLTPHGSRLVTYTPATADISPSKSGIPKATTTTGHILDEACGHLIKVDPRFAPVIKEHYCRVFSPEGLAEDEDPYQSLVSGIISQQVSGAAAASIKKKFIGLFIKETNGAASKPAFPLPEDVAKADVPFLRTAGLSERKAEYVKGLSEKFASGELTAKWLIEAPYDEMVEKLVAIRGLGRWSVEMFACFSLKRMDVFSLGDLGIQRGVGVMLNRDVKKLKGKGGKWKYATEKEMEEFAAPFSPYRSLLMWYLWKVSDTAVGAIQD